MKKQPLENLPLVQEKNIRNIDESLLIPSAFPRAGFATFDTPLLSEKEVLEAYQWLDTIDQIVDTEYDENFALLDKDTSLFAARSKYLTDDSIVPILFKNMKKDSIKYRGLTQNTIDHQMLSFHYIGGLYEYLSRSQKEYHIPEKVDLFLKTLDTQEKEISKRMLPLLNGVQKKTNYFTSLKIWKHTFEPRHRFLLPIHYDRSLFSVILHTKNGGEEFLKIFPNEEGLMLSEVRKKHRPYLLSPADFPLIFPGWPAKALFGFEPTPHSVEGKTDCPTYRNSYIWFISAK